MVAPSADAGVVEDQVDLAVVGDDLVGPGVHRVAVGDVDALRRDLHAAPSHSATVSARPTSSMSDSARWAPRRASSIGQGPADAGAGAGDGGDPAVEVLHRAAASGTSTAARSHRVGEHHGVVVDAAQLQGPVVAEVALVHLPRELRALLREPVGRRAGCSPTMRPSSGAAVTAASSLHRRALAQARSSRMWLSSRVT